MTILWLSWLCFIYTHIISYIYIYKLYYTYIYDVRLQDMNNVSQLLLAGGSWMQLSVFWNHPPEEQHLQTYHHIATMWVKQQTTSQFYHPWVVSTIKIWVVYDCFTHSRCFVQSVKLRCSWIYHRFAASNHWFKDHLKEKNKHFCRSFHSYVSLPEGKPSTYWDTPMETYGSYRSFQVFPHFSASKTTTPTPCVSPGLEVLGVLPQLVFQLSGPGHWRNQTSHMTY